MSYLRPCEALEQQILFPNDPLDNAAAVNQDVVTIMKSLVLLNDFVEGFEDHIYSCVLQGGSVDDVIKQVVHAITTRLVYVLTVCHCALASFIAALVRFTVLLIGFSNIRVVW